MVSSTWSCAGLLVIGLATLVTLNCTLSMDTTLRPSVKYPDRVVLSNKTKPFTVRVSRFVCVETPYALTELLYCKIRLRRNEPTLFNMSIRVPMVLNTVYLQVKTYYKYMTYQIFPIDLHEEVCAYMKQPSNDIFSRHAFSVLMETMPQYMYPCPHGNTTYTIAYWLEERFFPDSMPAGDFRMDCWFRNGANQTLFAYQVFFSVRRRGVVPSMLNW
ncbi:uncharacterized protein LOC126570111 [Anopheles aquasalis]|uniref:uncharacterized protein LOC126570111 n=1 Tax=Anopheles aquasalis TaxID=42839 RepID=UPI00215AEB20|nr:uncharacterized protein LOC126570111 [Anopheles aquasalis]